MSDSPPPLRPLRTLLILAVLFTVGLCGYTGQVWWARRVARRALNTKRFSYDDYGRLTSVHPSPAPAPPPDSLIERVEKGTCLNLEFIEDWKMTPLWGYYVKGYGWVPRRTFYEALRLQTGASLPNDPEAWEAWIKEHPSQSWNKERGRLIDQSELR